MNTDNEMVIIRRDSPDKFTEAVNSYLEQGCWRVAQTEMSVTDSHYWAMLIKSAANPSPKDTT